MEKILVIKHGSFGQFIQSVGAMRAIRMKHPNADISLITTLPQVKLASQLSEHTGTFNRIQVDATAAGIKSRFKNLKIVNWIRKEKFDFVYDLENSNRTSLYFKLLFPKPNWSGIVKNCSHQYNAPHRCKLHFTDQLKEQLHVAGIEAIPSNDLSWLQDTNKVNISGPYALLLPNTDNGWSLTGYIALAKHLLSRNIRPLLICAENSQRSQDIAKSDARIIDLTSKVTFSDPATLATLARGAQYAVGEHNDFMHLISLVGCKSIVLCDHNIDPRLHVQRGEDVTIIRVKDLEALKIETVLEQLNDSNVVASPRITQLTMQ